MLLAAIALSVSTLLGTPGAFVFSAQPASPRSQLPATQPGLSRNEGVFLVTAADDGSRLVYFIAQNTRHSTLPADLQVEQQLNSLWPVRLASREEVLAFAEAAPVGSARPGLLTSRLAAIEPAPLEEAPATAEAPTEPLLVASAPVVASMPAGADSVEYVLQRGDNLTRISARYGITIEALLAANGVTDANRIYIGQALRIPGAASTPDELVAEPGPAESPVTTAPSVDAEVPAAGADALTYTVKVGDSAIHIARQFGVDVDELLAANNVANRNRVYVGQVLAIPGA